MLLIGYDMSKVDHSIICRQQAFAGIQFIVKPHISQKIESSQNDTCVKYWLCSFQMNKVNRGLSKQSEYFSDQ